MAPGRRRSAVVMALLVTALSGIGYTITSTAGPALVTDLDGFHLYGWMVAGYALAATITLPIFGKLSDVHGRRPLLLWSLGLFAVGSTLAGLAPSMLWLIPATIIRGLGGGGMMSLAIATLADVFAPRERARWFGAASMVYGVASIAGPIAGGVITDRLGWRAVFLVLAPGAALGWVLVRATLPRPSVEPTRRLDLPGSVLLTCSLTAVMLGFTCGGTTFSWGSWQEIIIFSCGAVMLTMFVLVERRAHDPMLAPSLFRSRIFTLSLLISFVMSGAWYAALSFTPLFIQGVTGQSAQRSGLILAPMMAAFAAAAVVSGQALTRTGRHKLLSLAGASLLMLGFAIFVRLPSFSGSTEVILAMVATGLGIGILTPVVTIGAQTAAPRDMVGTVIASRGLFSNMGSAVLVPMMTAVLVNGFRHGPPHGAPDHLRAQLGGGALDPRQFLTEQSQAQLGARLRALPNGETLYHELLASVHGALTSGLTDVYVVGLVLSCGVGILVIALPAAFPGISGQERRRTGRRIGVV